MKRYLFLLLLISIILGTIGCSNGAYNSKEAIKRGDVVTRDEVANIERFENFLTNISNKKEDTIRVTGYTHEGDPIFQDLQFDGKAIQYTYDDSNDQHGGDDKGIEKDVCNNLFM